MELLAKYPAKYEVKAFDIDGVKLDLFNSYRKFLDQETKEKATSSKFIETIKPFLIFYKNLPDYAKSTARLSKEALSIREAISKSKDPEQTFFESFPNALGYTISELQKSKSKLKTYTLSLQKAILELRTSCDELINRVESFIQSEFMGNAIDFDKYQPELQKRYKLMKRHLLLPKQKAFLLRLDSQIDDRNAWINSITQAIAGKTLDKFTDEDEVLLYDQFKSMILELDSLAEISVSDFTEEEDVFSLEINSFIEGVRKKLVRLPKKKRAEVSKLEGQIMKILSNDKTANIAALTGILNNLFKK